MNDEIAFVVKEGCPACDTLKNILKEKGLNPRIIEASTPEGKAFADKNNIDAVPECVIIIRNQENEIVKTCTEQDIIDYLKNENKKGVNRK